MGQDVYIRLVERMNKNHIKHEPTESRLKLLRELYTEEQATFVADFPLGAYTSKSLSRVIDRNEAELDKILSEMSENGLIFEAKNEKNEKEYSVLPFEPGLMELQVLKGKDDERTRKFAQLMIDAGEEESAILEELLKQPEVAKEALAEPLGRIVAIEENISDDKELTSWERLTHIIENERSYAVGECGCKHIAKLKGDPCKVEGAPSKCCVWFGKAADYLVEREYAKRFNKEELYNLLKKCEEAGLVHFTSNLSLTNNIVMCNCCKCCCAYLGTNRKVRTAGIQFVATTNFVTSVDKESCTGCEECINYCQAEALQLSGDTVNVNEEYCLGCGVCVSKCPMESLSLVRYSHIKPPKPEIEIVGCGV